MLACASFQHKSAQTKEHSMSNPKAGARPRQKITMAEIREAFYPNAMRSNGVADNRPVLRAFRRGNARSVGSNKSLKLSLKYLKSRIL